MPVNEYQCTECGFDFERVRRFGEPHPTECDWPFCTGKVRQVYHPFVFKMRRAGYKSYSAESSTGAEKHMAAQIGEDELVR